MADLHNCCVRQDITETEGTLTAKSKSQMAKMAVVGPLLSCFATGGQDDESAEEVQEQLRREWGAVSVENEQTDYEVDTAELQSKVS